MQDTVAGPRSGLWLAARRERFLPWPASMLLGRETLTISGVGQTEPVVLAPAIVAQALGREGYAKVSPAETLRLFEQSLARNRPYLRQLAIAARVAGPSLRDCGDVRLLTLVRGEIRRGGL